MKIIFVLSILVCGIASPALGALDDADLDKIRLIINAELEPIKADIVSLKTDVAWMRAKFESVDKQFETVDKRYDAVDKRFDTDNKRFDATNKRFDAVDRQIEHLTYVTYGLFVLAVAAIVIPQILIALRSGPDRSLERQVEVLTQKIETLEQQRSVNR